METPIKSFQPVSEASAGRWLWAARVCAILAAILAVYWTGQLYLVISYVLLLVLLWVWPGKLSVGLAIIVGAFGFVAALPRVIISGGAGWWGINAGLLLLINLALALTAIKALLGIKAHSPQTTALPSVAVRWVWAVRLAAALSTIPSWIALGLLVAAMSSGPCAARPQTETTFLIPVMLPYLGILLQLRPATWKKGLALAVATGLLFPALVYFPLAETLVREKLPAWAIAFGLTQVAMVVSAIKAYYTMEREPDDRRELRGGFLAFVGLAFVCFVFQVVSIPPLVRSRLLAYQTSSQASLRSLTTAEITYDATYNKGYSPTLASLGPGPSAVPPTASAANLIDEVLAGHGGNTSVKSGYIFTYKPGSPDPSGRIKTFTVIAVPTEFGATGCLDSFLDETGVIRSTRENRPATAQDPALP